VVSRLRRLERLSRLSRARRNVFDAVGLQRPTIMRHLRLRLRGAVVRGAEPFLVEGVSNPSLVVPVMPSSHD